MIYAPRLSFALVLPGLAFGGIIGGEELAISFAAIGFFIGYLLWIAAKLKAVAAGQSFHLGSVLGTFLCTMAGIAAAIVGFFGKDAISAGTLWATVFPFAALVSWLLWRRATNVRLLPPKHVVLEEAKHIAFVTIKEPGDVAFESFTDITKEAVHAMRRQRAAGPITAGPAHEPSARKPA
jgi:hypothetical protein